VKTKGRDSGLTLVISFGHLQYLRFAVDLSDEFDGVVEIS